MKSLGLWIRRWLWSEVAVYLTLGALAAGVLAGVTVFADEQSHGSAGYWGERRLPVGRVWAVKLISHALFAVWLVFLLVLLPITRPRALLSWRTLDLLVLLSFTVSLIASWSGSASCRSGMPRNCHGTDQRRSRQTGNSPCQ